MSQWNHETRMPVVIAAFNEEQHIARTLRGLDSETAAPLVVVNGSTDKTAEIARSFTDQVVELDEQGKLPALQHGVGMLGKQALNGILFLDADSTPRYPRDWTEDMSWPFMGESGPVVSVGRIRFTDGNVAANALRSFRRSQEAKKAEQAHTTSAVYGANMGVQFSNVDILDEFMQIEHVWPGEDKLIADMILRSGGKLVYVNDKHADVNTSARFYPSLKDRILLGPERAVAKNQGNYLTRTAPSVVGSYVDGHIVPTPLEDPAPSLTEA